MHVRLDREEMLKMERAILYLQENPQNEEALEIVRSSINKCFGIQADVKVIDPDPKTPWFVMSVYPDQSTTDKIIDALMRNEDQKVIQRLWEKTDIWNIEIDQRIFGINPRFTEKELVAILLHEIGHVVISNSISRRVSTIMRYKIAMINSGTKMLLRDKVFKRILSLPILNACVTRNNKTRDELKDEIKADSFVSKAGYKHHLVTALNKLAPSAEFKDGDREMEDVTRFSLNTLDQFRQRKDNLVRESVDTLISNMNESPYMQNVIEDIYSFMYEKPDFEESVFLNSNVEFAHERAEKVIEKEFFTEAFDVFKRKLKRLNPTDIDYVDMKSMQLQNVDDKMMLISFCRSKIDMIDYYISILENPTLSKKYVCPHTIPELENMKQRYMTAIEGVKAAKLPIYQPGMLVKWPTGYEG